jgi:DNA-binding beta-propeller fold protein YncE
MSQLSIASDGTRDHLADSLSANTVEPIQVRADPSALVFDPHTNVLYVADGYSGAIVRVTENQQRVATIDSGGVITTNRIGGLALAPDGTLFASRIGNGQAGAILRIPVEGGRAEPLPKVPLRAWRGALVHDGERLFATQYMRSSSGAFDGSIVEVDATGTCSNVIDGFLHPTGIAKLGNVLVVADARQRAVFRVSLAGGRGVLRYQLACNIDRPDSLCACGDDSVLVTTFDDYDEQGSVVRLWLDGRSQVIARGGWEPRGIATDGARAFVAMRRTGTVKVFDL